jgi:alanine racemase
MTVRLTVDRARWLEHVNATLDAIGRHAEPVPVVKGNGYGFGRARLAGIAADLADRICVGTVHELNDLPTGIEPVVLTPTLIEPPTDDVILTVAHADHIRVLADKPRRVLVKLASQMHRYGGDASLIDEATEAGLEVVGVSIHPPLAGSDQEHIDQILAHLPDLAPELDVWISHVGPEAIAALPDDRRWRVRVGTALWHGERSALHLEAQVLDVRRVSAGDTAGYRQVSVPVDGHLVMVGAGTANGVHPLDDGRSPFHHRRTRLDLLEPPHMHTSMLICPNDISPPSIGDWLDLQRPLTWTGIDEIDWT